MGQPQDILGIILWNIGSSICHQLPQRSFFVDGIQYPVCARDSGTFIAFFIVLLFSFIFKRYRRAGIPDFAIIILSFIGYILFAFDGLSSYFGFRETSNLFRLVTGLLMGAGIGFFIVTLIGFVILDSKDRTKSFTWKDVLPIYLTLAFVGSCVYYIHSGLAFYYIISLMIIFGYLLAGFVLFNLIVALVTNKTYKDRKAMIFIIIISIIIQILFVSLLWLGHRWAGTVV